MGTDGMLHVIDVGGGTLDVVFSSVYGTGKHSVSSRSGAEHFVRQTLGCGAAQDEIDNLLAGRSGLPVNVEEADYASYFST